MNFVSINGVVSPDYDEEQIKKMLKVNNFDNVLYLGADNFIRVTSYGSRQYYTLCKLRRRKADNSLFVISSFVPYELNSLILHILNKGGKNQ